MKSVETKGLIFRLNGTSKCKCREGIPSWISLSLTLLNNIMDMRPIPDTSPPSIIPEEKNFAIKLVKKARSKGLQQSITTW